MCRPLSFAHVPLYAASYLYIRCDILDVLDPHDFVALVYFALSTARVVGGVVVLQRSREVAEHVELQCADRLLHECDNSLDFNTLVVETVVTVLFSDWSAEHQ